MLFNIYENNDELFLFIINHHFLIFYNMLIKLIRMIIQSHYLKINREDNMTKYTMLFL